MFQNDIYNSCMYDTWRIFYGKIMTASVLKYKTCFDLDLDQKTSYILRHPKMLFSFRFIFHCLHTPATACSSLLQHTVAFQHNSVYALSP
jgi:hypothetical protein